MSGEAIEPFANNWAYLRTELAWLDRVLSLAITRKSNESKAINSLARSRADRVTSHWWKGLVNLDTVVAADSPVEAPRRRSEQGNYQQQLEARIQASQQAGIVLGIPTLCHRLQLTKFEKQVILLTLAPEVSHRYAQIYAYLQEREQNGTSGLPTVDLLLRLLCRTESEWGLARQSFAADGTLLSHDLIEVQSITPEALLGRSVKLSDPLVQFLLSDCPSLASLDNWLPALEQPLNIGGIANLLECWQPQPALPADPWSTLVLPDYLLNHLKFLATRMQVSPSTSLVAPTDTPGQVVIFSGLPGTGKTTAARTIAQALNQLLFHIDLAALETKLYPSFLQQITATDPGLLMLTSAQKWFGRSAAITEATTHNFIKKRQQSASLTILCVEYIHQIRPYWRQQLTVLEFSLPTTEQRLCLWEQALPEDICRRSEIDWSKLAKLRLTGEQIAAIAQSVTIYAATENVPRVLGKHLIQALTLHLPQQKPHFLNKLLRK